MAHAAMPAAPPRRAEARLDPRRAALIELALAVGGFAIGTGEFATMGFLPGLAHTLNVIQPEAGHVISAYALGVVVGSPIIAVLAASVPRRTLLIGPMGLFSLGNLLSALAPGYGPLLACVGLLPTHASPKS